MRWNLMVSSLALALLMTAGCKQQCFSPSCDDAHYRNLMPQWLETTQVSITPTTLLNEPEPATIFNPTRPPRYISLAECIAITLEQGNVGDADPNRLLGVQGVRAPGFASDNIRVLALNPPIGAAAIDLSLSKFDAIWNTSLNWNNTDRPIGTPLDTFQAQGQGTNAIEQQEANFNTGVLKPLPTGGVAGITLNTDYQFTNLPSRVNPSYRPALQFQFEQPLLQGYGVEINQLRGRHPGNLLTPGRLFNLQPSQEGILITRIRFDQDRAEFERRIHLMLLNVESAYWTLYGSYWTLFAQEQGLRFAYESWKITNEQFKVGRKSETDLAQARAQYELFRSQRLAALGTGGGGGGVQPLAVAQQPGVLEAERQLRNLLNLPPEDNTRLVPVDTPTLAPYRPDWNVAINETLALRPELVMARQELKTRQLNLIEARNNLLPDLRVAGTYDINGIGNRLDGAGTDNAARSLAHNHFNNWGIFLNLNVPIGYRQAYANLRITKLNLAQSYAMLREQELRALRALEVPYRQILELYEQIGIQRSQREAVAIQLRGQFEKVIAGQLTIDALLESQRLWANALSTEYNFIIQYNIQLANFEFNKGTILAHNNVHIAEGQLPQCAQVRAVEHERQRSLGLVLRHRANPIFHEKCDPLECADKVPLEGAPGLPSLIEFAPPPPLIPAEKMRPPKPLDPAAMRRNDPPMNLPVGLEPNPRPLDKQ